MAERVSGSAERPGRGGTAAAEPALLAACRRRPVPWTPVWVMRQAGRYLPEYRKLREKVDFLTLTKTPELAVEVTLQPIRRFDLDAAILFSDIMTPIEAMGVGIEFAPGPVVAEPVRDAAAVERLRVPEPEEAIPFVLETVRILARELPERAPLIGFVGAPWTLFCYLVEGRGSKSFPHAKAFLLAEPAAARRLLDRLADTVGACLAAQARAGARAVMLFDSWAGLLSPDDYRAFARPAVERALTALDGIDAPRIYFPHQGATLLEDVRELPVDVVGLDWRLPLGRAREILGDGLAVQGNLDPAALFAPPEELERRIDAVLAEAAGRPGHIFNLGHGIERTTSPDAVARLVERVHEKTRSPR